MRFGRQPVISETAVQAVLDTLAFSTSDKDEATPLQYLFLVEEKLLDPKTPRSEKQRSYVIKLLLIEIISNELRDLRHRFDQDVDVNETYQDAIQSLSSDSQNQSNELISWSILFYLYAQIDLGLTIDSIATVIGVTSRTLRRYRKHGVQLLTQKLWECETECRRNYHYKSINSQLEPRNTDVFVGRECEIEKVINNIIDKQRNIVYVHGEKGIGKTSFIQHVIVKLMDHMPVDELLWLNNIEGNEIGQIRHHFVANSPDISPSSIFRLFNCIVVLDDSDDLLKSSNFYELFDFLQGAIVFFSSTFHYSVTVSMVQIKLEAFNPDTTENIIEAALTDNTSYEVVNNIRDLSGGNPQKINYLINYHKYSLPSQSQVTLISGLKLEQRILLLFVPIQDGLLFKDVILICDILQISQGDIDFLLELKFLSQSENRIYGRVKSHILVNTLVQISVHISKFIDQISILHEPWIFSTHVLSTYSSHLDDELILKIIDKHWRTGLRNGNKVTWYSILLEIPQSELWIGLAKAVSHKEMNELYLAESMLQELLNLSGLKGDFSLQAEITLELVKVYRLQSRYKQALYHLNIIDKSLKIHLKTQQYKIYILEQAQLAIDMDQSDYAITLVTPLKSMESLMIKAEALYRLNQYQECLQICHSLLIDFSLPNLMRGIVHNLIGRCHQDVNYEYATNEFDLAIEYLSQTFNLRHLSHAQINLATAFIHLDEIEDAIQTLNHAEEVCQITHDKLGMKIIQKNKAYIHRIIASKY